MNSNSNITGETIDDINDVIRRNDFVNRVLSMIRRDIENDGGTIVNTGGIEMAGDIEMTGGIEMTGYASFVNAGGIDDEFLDTLFTTHVFDVSYEYIEKRYRIDIFDLYEIDEIADMIKAMFINYVNYMNEIEGK